MKMIENCLTDCTQLSEKLLLIGILFLVFNFFPMRTVCNYVRQLFYILQTIRIALVLAGILPFVLHEQLTSVHPKLDYSANPHLIVLSLIMNVGLAFALRYLIKKRQWAIPRK